MKIAGKLAAKMIHAILRTICKVDSTEIDKIPMKGPFVIAINHTNFLEVPMIFTHLQPRTAVGIVKKETWNKGLTKFLAKHWNAIPVDREKQSTDTFRKARRVLKDGNFLIIAPEGTRNQTGILIEGKPGVISIALRSKVPIIPVAHFGGENIHKNLKKFKRTSFKFKVGIPIIFNPSGKVDSEKRKYLTDQVMYRIAELLPEQNRGVYSALENIKDDEILEIKLDTVKEKR